MLHLKFKKKKNETETVNNEKIQSKLDVAKVFFLILNVQQNSSKTLRSNGLELED